MYVFVVVVVRGRGRWEGVETHKNRMLESVSVKKVIFFLTVLFSYPPCVPGGHPFAVGDVPVSVIPRRFLQFSDSRRLPPPPPTHRRHLWKNFWGLHSVPNDGHGRAPVLHSKYLDNTTWDRRRWPAPSPWLLLECGPRSNSRSSRHLLRTSWRAASRNGLAAWIILSFTTPMA